VTVFLQEPKAKNRGAIGAFGVVSIRIHIVFSCETVVIPILFVATIFAVWYFCVLRSAALLADEAEAAANADSVLLVEGAAILPPLTFNASVPRVLPNGTIEIVEVSFRSQQVQILVKLNITDISLPVVGVSKQQIIYDYWSWFLSWIVFGVKIPFEYSWG